MALNIDHIHRVHCVGLGGIGVSAVAKLLRLQGKEVTGSDLKRTIVTDDAERAGVAFREPSVDNVSPDLDLLIYTPAAPEDQIERVVAAKLGIPQFSYPEFLGLLAQGRVTVAVCGTNGKSTTTAMLGLVLEAAGLDPLVIVGSRVTAFPYGNLRPGKGNIFVVEACEYKSGFLAIAPTHVVVTNVTMDHLDYFRDLAHIQETFQAFIAKQPADGLLITNADDAGSSVLETAGPRRTFGWSIDAGYRAKKVSVSGERQRVTIARKESKETWPEIALRVPGRFNAENALAAAAMARELGVAPEIIKETLERFPGVWRRFERVGVTPDGAPVISDYGHNPEAVAGTLKAAHAFFPDRRVVLVFQPHHHGRTRTLFDAFVESFDEADALVLAEIYGVAGRLEGEEAVSSKDLVQAVEARDRKTKHPPAGRHGDRTVRFAADKEEALDVTRSLMRPDDLIIVMGAGDIYTITGKLVG